MKIRIVVRMILLLTGTASVTFGCVSHIPDRTQAGAEGPELTRFDQQPEGEKEQITDLQNKTEWAFYPGAGKMIRHFDMTLCRSPWGSGRPPRRPTS